MKSKGEGKVQRISLFGTLTLLSSFYFNFIVVFCSLVIHLNIFIFSVYLSISIYYNIILHMYNCGGYSIKELFCPLFSLTKFILDIYFSYLSFLHIINLHFNLIILSLCIQWYKSKFYKDLIKLFCKNLINLSSINWFHYWLWPVHSVF